MKPDLLPPGIIMQTAPENCDYCKYKRELRPYGANGEFICFDCGMKDIETTKARFTAIIKAVTENPPRGTAQ